jgi:uncharacterized membrane protein YdbT with pleckstrin-like domain
MGYIEKSLGINEQVVRKFKIHWISYIIPVATAFIIIGIPALIRLLTTEYAVTSKRVILKTGFISRNTEELLLKKAETVEIKQGILGRILGYGDVKVTGTGVSFVLFKTVQNPMAAKRLIENSVPE